MAQPDWTLVQSFLAVAETGSLTQAAARLGSSQPTVGRRIRALEEALGLTLVQRNARGLSLTEAGLDLLPAARDMAAAAHRLDLASAGRGGLSGTVRITASKVTAHHILPAAIARIRQEHPEITVELAPSDASDNLIYREADIAVRMYRPTQLDVVARYVGTLGLGIYGATSYLDRVGRPLGPEDLDRVEVIGYDRDERLIRGMRALGLPATREMFRTRCDDQVTYWELVRAGCGLGATQSLVGDADPLVERVLPDLHIPGLPVWLVSHEALRGTPRIRAVWDILFDVLSPLVEKDAAPA